MPSITQFKVQNKKIRVNCAVSVDRSLTCDKHWNSGKSLAIIAKK